MRKLKSIINEIKKNSIVKKVENSLGIKLMDWQKEFILGDCDYIRLPYNGGKVLACILKLFLTDGDTIVVSETLLRRHRINKEYCQIKLCNNGPYILLDGTNLEILYNNMKEIYERLSKSGLKLRNIVFV